MRFPTNAGAQSETELEGRRRTRGGRGGHGWIRKSRSDLLECSTSLAKTHALEMSNGDVNWACPNASKGHYFF